MHASCTRSIGGARGRGLKRDIYALSLAYRDPRTPWPARPVTICVVGYAFSPIDLIPDVVPLLGYLDDLVLVPLGILLAIKLLPTPVLADARQAAATALDQEPRLNWVAAGLIVAIWLLLAVALVVAVLRYA